MSNGSSSTTSSRGKSWPIQTPPKTRFWTSPASIQKTSPWTTQNKHFRLLGYQRLFWAIPDPPRSCIFLSNCMRGIEIRDFNMAVPHVSPSKQWFMYVFYTTWKFHWGWESRISVVTLIYVRILQHIYRLKLTRPPRASRSHQKDDKIQISSVFNKLTN